MRLKNNKYINSNNSLKTVHWIISRRCNENCHFCFSKGNTNEISLKEAKKIIYRLKSDGWKTIKISGGEPLLYPYIKEVLKELKRNNFIIHLHTNAILIDFQWLVENNEYIDYLSLSLEGFSIESQKLMTRNKNHFNNVIQILEWINQSNFKFEVEVKTVVSKINYESLISVGELLLSHKLKYWILLEFRPNGPATKRSNQFALESGHFDSLPNKLQSFLDKIDILFISQKDAISPYLFIYPDGKAYTVNLKGDSNIFVCDLIESIPNNIREKLIKIHETN